MEHRTQSRHALGPLLAQLKLQTGGWAAKKLSVAAASVAPLDVTGACICLEMLGQMPYMLLYKP